MTISEIISYTFGAVGASMAILSFRDMRRRAKESTMALINKDITTIKVDMGAIKAHFEHTATKEDMVAVKSQLAYTSTKEDIALVRAELAELKAEILNALKNERGV